jgi:hypothetical protein
MNMDREDISSNEVSDTIDELVDSRRHELLTTNFPETNSKNNEFDSGPDLGRRRLLKTSAASLTSFSSVVGLSGRAVADHNWQTTSRKTDDFSDDDPNENITLGVATSGPKETPDDDAQFGIKFELDQNEDDNSSGYYYIENLRIEFKEYSNNPTSMEVHSVEPRDDEDEDNYPEPIEVLEDVVWAFFPPPFSIILALGESQSDPPLDWGRFDGDRSGAWVNWNTRIKSNKEGGVNIAVDLNEDGHANSGTYSFLTKMTGDVIYKAREYKEQKDSLWVSNYISLDYTG